MGVLDLVKKHPVPAFIGGIVVVGGVILVSSSGGGGAATVQSAGSDPNLVAASTQMQQMQIQAQTANNQLATALAAKKEDNATAIELAKLQGTYSLQNTGLAAEIEKMRLEKEYATQQQYNTLQAQNASQQYELQKSIEQSRNSTTIELQRMMTDVLKTQTQAQVSIAQITKPKQGWFSKIFG